jgi:hypothetical protein
LLHKSIKKFTIGFCLLRQFFLLELWFHSVRESALFWAIDIFKKKGIDIKEIFTQITTAMKRKVKTALFMVPMVYKLQPAHCPSVNVQMQLFRTRSDYYIDEVKSVIDVARGKAARFSPPDVFPQRHLLHAPVKSQPTNDFPAWWTLSRFELITSSLPRVIVNKIFHPVRLRFYFLFREHQNFAVPVLLKSWLMIF